MGKASKWFRNLLGLKKPDPFPNPPPQNKKKWSFTKSQKRNDVVQFNDDSNNNKNRQAVSVSVSVSDSVYVRKSNNKGSVAADVRRSYGRRREEWAAILIQSHFRAYLSRRALRALKGLVKLQALVRGHLVRKRTADALRQLQALVRAQRRARVGRILSSESPYSSLKSSYFTHHEPATPEKHEQVIRARSRKFEQSMMLKRNSSKSKSSGSVNYDLEKSHLSRFRTDNRVHNNNLEVDPKKQHRRNFFHSSHLSLGSDPTCHSFSTSKESTARQAIFSPESNEVQSLSPMKFVEDLDESDFHTADNSPRFYSASSSRREEFTPTKSDCSRSCLSNFSDYPSYMSYTESSKAKVRSVSAPKQRPQYERSGSTKRYSINGFGEPRLSTQRVSQMQANFVSKAYPGSGRLDRLGMPVGGDVSGFSGGLFHRY